MLPSKAKDITKSVIVAIAASLLCLYIFLPLFSSPLSKAVSVIEKGWLTDCHARLLIITYGNDVADAITFGVSGLLTGVLIGFVLKNNRMLTTTLALLTVTIVAVICYLEIIPNIPQDVKSSVLISIGLKFLFSMVFFWGFGFLGIWLISRRKRKTGQQSLPGEKETCAEQ
jgi:hypothetical protein